MKHYYLNSTTLIIRCTKLFRMFQLCSTLDLKFDHISFSLGDVSRGSSVAPRRLEELEPIILVINYFSALGIK